MKYSEYKQLSPEAKEEWNYRFQNHVNDAHKMVTSASLFLCTFLILFALSMSLFLAAQNTPDLKIAAENMYHQVQKLMGVGMMIYVADLVIVLIKYAYEYWCIRNFKKKHLPTTKVTRLH